MEIRQVRNSDRPTEARGMNHGLAAVIALTLALAAALQAGFSRLATQSAIAAVISVGEGRERAARVAQVQGQIAVQARKNPAHVAGSFEKCPAMGAGRVEGGFDLAAHCRAGLGAMPPPVG